eukprot:CAMPEP_0173233220 /NCGR_PEP_ID=MMETSP1142-20121109/9472_1 /TAXON_ID=483371 /ORGANISM="non described non described, Strain CCMP2298" /LENGTH=153 /DNA_ID=CAMNT_0014162971 /DNA_START=451 /DNA_END=914 /DNA_ORIENTATION=+
MVTVGVSTSDSSTTTAFPCVLQARRKLHMLHVDDSLPAQQTVRDRRRGGERVGVQKRRELLLGAGAARSGLHSEDAPPGRPAAPDELVTSRSSSSQAPMELGLSSLSGASVCSVLRTTLLQPPHSDASREHCARTAVEVRRETLLPMLRISSA